MCLDLVANIKIRKFVHDSGDFNVQACCLECFQWKKWGVEP
jgi:hypothetical protein